MKKPYQIGAGRAVQRVRQWAEEKDPAVQLVLPMIEILALAKQGAGELVREAGLRVILLAIQQEADALTGTRHHHGPDRQALRWSREDGFVVVDGQKVPIERRRLRGNVSRGRRESGRRGGGLRAGRCRVGSRCSRHIENGARIEFTHWTSVPPCRAPRQCLRAAQAHRSRLT